MVAPYLTTGQPMLLKYDPDCQQQTLAKACVYELEKAIGTAKSATSGLSLAAWESWLDQVIPGTSLRSKLP